METPKEYHYTYYSYEEWGMGYFGSRTCKCLPEEDVKYFGTYSHKNFNPTQKIILKSNYDTRKEAIQDEISLQQYYKVVENSHFANRAYQTSTGFYYDKGPGEESKKRRSELMKTNFNPMSNPELREKARINLIKSANTPSSIEKRKKYTKEVANRPEERERRRLTAIKSHQNPEMKRKYIESKLGEKNSCYGKMWITDGNQNKYINSLGEQIPDGWYRGRFIIKGKSKWWVSPEGITKCQQECPGDEWKRGMIYK
jgi:hypothetical protein